MVNDMPLNVFTVRGRERYDQDLLVCRTLKFEQANVGPHQGESKLVIVPKPGADGATRVLKIVANKIDLKGAWDQPSQSGVAEITYDLDGDALKKLDPETPAKDVLLPGAQGADGDPHFGLGGTTNTCGYPVGRDGGHGQQGGRGAKGEKGQNGPILEIWVHEVDGQELTIDIRGQQGGKGGKGGKGGSGGKGEDGCPADLEDDWIGKSCKQGPGRGGDGGDGGNAGWGGDGGDGGNGGVVKIFYTTLGGADFSTWAFQLQGGKGGDHGDGGAPGSGRKGGSPGAAKVVCPHAEAGQEGEDGLTVEQILKRKDGSPESSPGQDGEDGYVKKTQITNIPRFP